LIERSIAPRSSHQGPRVRGRSCAGTSTSSSSPGRWSAASSSFLRRPAAFEATLPSSLPFVPLEGLQRPAPPGVVAPASPSHDDAP